MQKDLYMLRKAINKHVACTACGYSSYRLVSSKLLYKFLSKVPNITPFPYFKFQYLSKDGV